MSGTTYPVNPMGQKLKRVKRDWTAVGHAFDAHMVCGGCGVSYDHHQRNPTRCEKPKGEAVRRERVA